MVEQIDGPQVPDGAIRHVDTNTVIQYFADQNIRIGRARLVCSHKGLDAGVGQLVRVGSFAFHGHAGGVGAIVLYMDVI